MDKTYCCCCQEEIQPDLVNWITVSILLPEYGDVNCACAVCWNCANDYGVLTLRPVVEALINANLVRAKYPDIRFTPLKRNDEPSN